MLPSSIGTGLRPDTGGTRTPATRTFLLYPGSNSEGRWQGMILLTLLQR
jgi:hypothetical protein